MMNAPSLRRGIGLVGGTFDPIHQGHLALARAAWEGLALARVTFVPAGNPWQKSGITAPEHRLAMLQAAVRTLPSDQFGIDTQELLRTGPTYTIDTLEAYREKMGPAMPLVLIMGEDQWCNLTTWHRWEDLLKVCHLAIANRENGAKLPQALDFLLQCHRVDAKDLCLTPAGHIALFSMPAHRASATAIRDSLTRLSSREALLRVGDFLHPEVLAYIRDHKLYGTGASRE